MKIGLILYQSFNLNIPFSRAARWRPSCLFPEIHYFLALFRLSGGVHWGWGKKPRPELITWVLIRNMEVCRRVKRRRVMLLGGKKRNMLPSDLCLLARPGAARGRGRGHVNARLIQALTTPASQNWPNIHRQRGLS
jgi:hypothetical protein